MIEPFRSYRTVTLPQGDIRVFDAGSGPPIVFIHGVFVNSALWSRVIPPLLPLARCIAPDLPLGAHRTPLRPGADRSPLGVAQLIADLLEALDLRDVTLVGNDTGGALCQLVITRHPERIGRLVLTNCDAYEAFFPAAFNWIAAGARRGPGLIDRMARVLHNRVAQRAFVMAASRAGLPDAALDAIFAPLLTDPAIRADLTAFLGQVSNRLTLEAARSFGSFAKPVELLWSTDDLLFRPSLARRLQAAFPHATLELIKGSRAFVPLDRPDALVALLQRTLQTLPAEPYAARI